MTKINVLFSAALLLAVAGCDGSIGDEYRQERADKNYQRAMDEYRAGRMDQAVELLSDTLKDAPGNVSARFQLAVILQESKKDYLGALCNYTEYLRIAGNSDKSTLARDRRMICEKMLLAKLAADNGIGADPKTLEELESARAELEKATKKIAELTAAAEKNDKRLKTLERENASLSKTIKRLGDCEDDAPARPAPRASTAVAADAAAADDGAPQKPVAKPVAAAEREQEKPLTLNPEAKALFEEEEREARASGSDLLPQQAEKPAVTPKPKADATPSAFYRNPSMPDKPEFYVVQEGDTLMKIAKRFYGDRSKWSAIRSANKAIVPISGVIKVGTRLRLP